MSKICSKCKIEKDESEFGHNARMVDGLDYYCKDCRNTKYNPNQHKELVSFVESLKTNCCKCGEDRPWVIQFHHINPKDKRFSISQCGTRSKDSIRKEISKCVCLCSNCHDEFHYFFGNTPIEPTEAFNNFINDNY